MRHLLRMTFSITTLSIIDFIAILSIGDIQNGNSQHNNVTMDLIVTLSMEETQNKHLVSFCRVPFYIV